MTDGAPLPPPTPAPTPAPTTTPAPATEPGSPAETRRSGTADPRTMSGPSAEGLAPGKMSGSWRLMLAAAWVGAMFAYAAVWQASVQIGIATWWVGPRSEPAPALVRMIPFLLVFAVIVPIGYDRRYLHRVGLVGAMFAAVVAVPDLSRSVGLAVVELAIAAALALVSAMSSTGVARHPHQRSDSRPTRSGSDPNRR